MNQAMLNNQNNIGCIGVHVFLFMFSGCAKKDTERVRIIT